MTKGFTVVLLAAGLAGCGATPVEHRNYREIGPGEGLLSDTATGEWRRKQALDPAPSSAAPAQPAAVRAEDMNDFKKWRESAGSAERREFEDWRAWQDWKRRNPK